MTAVALDSSAVVTWITQSPGWHQVQRLVDRSDVELVLPGPVMAESIEVSRRKGNTMPPGDIAATLIAQGMSVELLTADDLVRAAELLEASRHNPVHPVTGKALTLSLGDALILAVVERLGCPVVTLDQYWSTIAAAGLTTARVAQLPTS